MNWYIGAQAGGWIEHAVSTCNDQNKGKFVIKERELPSRATDQREQIVRRLAANDASVDLIGMDVSGPPSSRTPAGSTSLPRRHEGQGQ